VPYDIPKEEEIQECDMRRKNHGYSLLDNKGVILENFFSREVTVNSDSFIETLKKPECLLSSSWSHKKKNITSVAHP
jgi:hypothetical protein